MGVVTLSYIGNQYICIVLKVELKLFSSRQILSYIGNQYICIVLKVELKLFSYMANFELHRKSIYVYSFKGRT